MMKKNNQKSPLQLKLKNKEESFNEVPTQYAEFEKCLKSKYIMMKILNKISKHACREFFKNV